jgi:hypothetical protein
VAKSSSNEQLSARIEIKKTRSVTKIIHWQDGWRQERWFALATMSMTGKYYALKRTPVMPIANIWVMTQA